MIYTWCKLNIPLCTYLFMYANLLICINWICIFILFYFIKNCPWWLCYLFGVGDQKGSGSSRGSGTIIDPNGTILTCGHLVLDSRGRKVTSKGKVRDENLFLWSCFWKIRMYVNRGRARNLTGLGWGGVGGGVLNCRFFFSQNERGAKNLIYVFFQFCKDDLTLKYQFFKIKRGQLLVL